MVKENKTRIEALEQENAILRKQAADNEARRIEIENVPQFDSLTNEMKKIRAKSKVSANSILVREVIDHKNISLWSKLGRRIGPMHPDNAIQTLNRFADMGIALSVDQPTPAQIEAYMQTAEYKALERREIARRKQKDKSRKSGQLEKLSEEIAKMSGTTVDAINKILQAHEVGKK